MAVSHTRLDRIWAGRDTVIDEVVSDADMKRLERAIRHAVGIAEIEF
jgi:hypothetical protein